MKKAHKDSLLEHLHVLLSPATLKKLEDAAARDGRKVSPMARRIIEQWLEAHDLA